MNWRRIPHPTYGHYGGLLKDGEDHSLAPIDDLDRAFKQHDLQVEEADTQARAGQITSLEDYRERLRQADRDLIKAAKEYKAKTFYAWLYQYGTIIVFSIHLWMIRIKQ